MFGFNDKDGPKPKCFFANTVLPNYVDHAQIPTKKKPLATVCEQKLSHSLSVFLPQERIESLKQKLNGGVGTLQYANVYMKPSELIEGDFFNQYIKTGNILMLSQGEPGVDNLFSLSDGLLRLEVDRPTYQRMGLEGKPIRGEGRKHTKTRFAIELNLRLPSMVRGKKGFERIIWAFKNALNQSVEWLFYDLEGPNDGSGPLAKHQPKVSKVEPDVSSMESAEVPVLPEVVDEHNYDAIIELLEWLTLAASGSPRIRRDDNIDPYISRYQVPTDAGMDANAEPNSIQDLATFRWHGFMPASFIQPILLAALKASDETWFAMSAASFDGKAYTILQHKHHTLTWEYMD